ncbi:hypothetical protein CCHOA_00855 [Corynebacterium choanae]|uniref:Uncharacterized protein n=1 Tax=Corynebacterium choanae TaxID=1862358 RepID=A0A3G6J827_9CORY|nr:hypothetical protein CCHOA_00855 [Corynebacterium choanae]
MYTTAQGRTGRLDTPLHDTLPTAAVRQLLPVGGCNNTHTVRAHKEATADYLGPH